MVDFGVSIRSFKIYAPKLGEKIRGIFVKDLHEPFFFLIHYYFIFSTFFQLLYNNCVVLTFIMC